MIRTAAIAVLASLLTTIGVLVAFPHFVQPAPPRYRFEHAGPGSFLVRIDEQTGDTEELFGSTWRKCGVAADVAPVALSQVPVQAAPLITDRTLDSTPPVSAPPPTGTIFDQIWAQKPEWQKAGWANIQSLVKAGYRLTDQDKQNILDEFHAAGEQPGPYQPPTPYELTHDLQKIDPEHPSPGTVFDETTKQPSAPH
jgi:hypothetical protein